MDRRDAFRRQIATRAEHKARARRDKRHGVWFGMGMFGMVGWSVAVPTLVGLALGLWIDRRWPGPFSWALMLLAAGLMLGCLNAWYWVQQANRE